MLTCEFVPSICKPSGETPAKYSGSIRLKPLSYEERMEMIEAQVAAQAAADTDEKKGMALLAFARHFSREKLAEYFVSSSITRLDDCYLFDSIEKIKYDGTVSSVIPEIANALISGELSLGK